MKEYMSGSGSSKGSEINSFDKHLKEGRTGPSSVVDSSRVSGEVVEIVSKNEDSIVEILKGVKRSQEISSIDELIMENLRGEANKSREEVEESVVEVDEPDNYSFKDVVDEVGNLDENIPKQSEIVETAPMGSGLIEKDSVSAFLNNIQGSLVMKRGRVSQKSKTKDFRKVTKELTTPTIPKEIVPKELLNVLEGENFIFTDHDCVNFPDRLIVSGKLDLSQVSNDVLRGLVSSGFLDRIQVNRLILSSHVDDRVLQEIKEYERGENILGQVEFSDNRVLDHEEELETFEGLFDNED